MIEYDTECELYNSRSIIHRRLYLAEQHGDDIQSSQTAYPLLLSYMPTHKAVLKSICGKVALTLLLSTGGYTAVAVTLMYRILYWTATSFRAGCGRLFSLQHRSTVSVAGGSGVSPTTTYVASPPRKDEHTRSCQSSYGAPLPASSGGCCIVS